ncbi:DUF4391 domain-containing protein [Halioglobus sp. Uisw_031]|uniref:DUF4391 domain-containing protein n=1 Tax=Halioglobus sp. Uisw_031 TaxID=3230977 RepID=UPI0039EB18B1
MMDDANKQNQPRTHWKFPETAKFGRVIPKEKLYSQAGANAELKKLFVEQVTQIKWAYKLAESTINLSKTEQVHELEVIHIKLKSQTLDEKILTAIDKAIPHPTLFMLTRDTKEANTTEQEIAYQAAHKLRTLTQSNKEKWQQSAYLKSQWLVPSSQHVAPLPAATSLESLYNQLLEALMPLGFQGAKNLQEPKSTYEHTKPLQEKRSLEDKLADLAAIEALNKQIKQIKVKRDKEKQFNRKRELNDQFKALKKQLAELIGG